MNCLTMALYAQVRMGGRLIVLKWMWPFPHFGVLKGDTVIHWFAWEDKLPWWRQFHYNGRFRRDHVRSL